MFYKLKTSEAHIRTTKIQKSSPTFTASLWFFHSTWYLQSSTDKRAAQAASLARRMSIHQQMQLHSSSSTDESKEDLEVWRQNEETELGRDSTRRRSLMSQTSVKKLFRWKSRYPFTTFYVIENRKEIIWFYLRSAVHRRTSAPVELDPGISGDISLANPLNMPETVPYNSTMQCYCGQNSCPFCNLLLNLERTETGLE